MTVAEEIIGVRSSRQRLVHYGLRLEYATLSWNVVGSVVVLAAAVLARSVALAGFGLDSLIEIIASLVVVWQLKGAGRAALATSKKPLQRNASRTCGSLGSAPTASNKTRQAGERCNRTREDTL